MAGKKGGFLTDSRRDYLKTQKKDRIGKYSESQKNQFDAAIREQAILALEDLILVARESDESGLNEIFSKHAVKELLDILMDRIGMEETEAGERYYDVVLKAIEYRIHEKYHEEGRFFKLESSDYPIMPSRPAYRDVKAYMRK